MFRRSSRLNRAQAARRRWRFLRLETLERRALLAAITTSSDEEIFPGAVIQRSASTEIVTSSGPIREPVPQLNGNGLQFNFIPAAGMSQQAIDGFEAAADLWSSILTDDIQVNINIDFTNLGSGILGQAGSTQTLTSYSNFRTAVTNDRKSVSDISSVLNLQPGSAFSLLINRTSDNPNGAGSATPYVDNDGGANNANIRINTANAKAAGLIAAGDPVVDASISFSSAFSWDFDRSNGITSSAFDFIGVAAHEIGHALGFVSGVDVLDFNSPPNGGPFPDNAFTYVAPLDLFRYSTTSFAQGAGVFDWTADNRTKYFSIDGGATQLTPTFSTGVSFGDGRQASHWKDNLEIGIMDPTAAPGEYADITDADVQAFDVIGWDVSMDFGDAPDTGAGTGAANYQTTLADDGPRHVLFDASGLLSDPAGAPKVYLGSGVTREFNGQPNAGATGDVDNGIASFPTLAQGTTANITVTSTGGGARLNYFFDFNKDGDFIDSGESFSATLNSTSQLVPVTIPAGAAQGSTLARFRISTAGSLGPTGPANDGEVEDYVVSIAPGGGNAAPTFTSSATPNAAENQTSVITVTATDPESNSLTFSLSGGVDQAKFSITSGGVLTFVAPPDFEAPTDNGANNVYNVQVQVTDGTNVVTQDIAVTVTDVNETGSSAVWTAAGGVIINGQTENITTPVNNPVSGAVHVVLPHPTNADIIWIGTTNGGVWKTTNATSPSPTWVPLIDEQASLSVGALVLDPTDATHNTLVAGIGKYSSFGRDGGARSGLLRTTDGGATWTPITGGGVMLGRNISGIAARGNTIVVSVNVADSFTYNNIGIFRSTNGGATFTQMSVTNGGATGLPGGVAYDLATDPMDPNVLYTSIVFAPGVGGVNGLYKSVNQGATWTKVSNSAMDALIIDSTTTNLEISVGTANNVFAAINNTGQLAGLFRSGDGGANWTQLDTPRTNENGTFVGINPNPKGPAPGSPAADVAGGQGTIHSSILADPVDPNIVYLGGDRQPSQMSGGVETGVWPNSLGATNYSGRLFRVNASLPLGSQAIALTHSATTSNNSSPHADSRDMAFDANGNIIEGDDGGIYKRTNPRTTGVWVGLHGNLQNTEFHSIAWDSTSNKIFGGTQDVGTPRQQVIGGNLIFNGILQADGGVVEIDTVTRAGTNESVRYVSFQRFGAFRRQVFNAAGDFVSESFPALSVVGFGQTLYQHDSSIQFYQPIILNSVTPTRALVGTNNLYETSDSFSTLNKIVSGSAPIIAMAYGGAGNADAIYYGTNAAAGDLFVRTTAGGGFTSLTAYPGGAPVDIVLDPDDWQTGYIVDASGVYRMNSAGTSFTNIAGSGATSLTTVSGGARIRSVTYVEGSSDDAVIVGTNVGTFLMRASAPGVWENYGPNLPNVPVMDLRYYAGDNVLIAGTLGRGAWTVPNANQTFGTTTNQPPTFTSSATPNAAENQTSVITVTASDPESNALTFSLSGGVDQARFSITSGGVLTFVAAPNFEAPTDNGGNNVYNVQVQVTDGTNIVTQDIAVTVTNVNEAPTITSNANASAPENQTSATTVTATDPENATLTYSIAGGADGALFSINSSTGVLSFIAAPNFEAPADAGANNIYDVQVRVTDGTNPVTQNVAVTVTNVNEAPSITSNANASAPENQTSATTVTATDPDAGSTLAFSIVGGVGDGALFAINATTGALTFIAAPNFEAPADSGANNIYDVRVQVSDGALTAIQNLQVSVTNVNEAPSFTSSATPSAAENQTGVLTVTATDPDTGTTLTYSLVGGADQAKFSITSGGVLTFVAAPNFEAPTDSGGNNVYDVQVQVSDGTNLVTQNIAVTVTNVNEAPSFTSSATPSAAENQTGVLTVTATDPDSGATLAYSLVGGADQAKFSITAGGVLTFVAAPNFEAPTDSGGNNVYDVQVQVSDGTNLVTQNIAVTVTNVNEAPSITSNAAFNTPENTTAVTTVTATDPDAGTTLTYSLVGGADQARFSITSGGVLTFVAAPNFEAPTDVGGNNVYDVQVQVSDGTNLVTQNIAVTVTNVNEAPSFTSSATPSAAENQTGVLTVTATDPDSGATLAYSLVGGADQARFSITAGGVLTFVAAPNFEVPTDADGNNTYLVNVQVSDGANLVVQNLTVTVTDVDEVPPSVSLTVTGFTSDTTPNVIVAASDAGSGVPNGTQVRLDIDLNNDGDFSDAGESPHTTATLSSGSASFPVGSALAEGTYRLRARVSDQAGNEGVSATHVVVVDTTAPAVTLTAPAFTNDTTPSVTVNVTDATTPNGTGVLIDVDKNNDGDFDDAGELGYSLSTLTGGSATFSLSPALAEGTVRLRAKVFDQAGNVGLSTVSTLVVDTTAPAVTLTAPAFTNDTTPSVTVGVVDANTPNGTQVRLDVDLNNNGTFEAGELTYVSALLNSGSATFDVSPALAQGTFRLRARVTDQATNEGSSAISTLVVDTTAPAVTLTAPAFTNDTTPSVTVNVVDTNTPNGTQVRLDVDLNNDGDFADTGESSYTTATLNSGSSTFDVSPALAQGTYRLRARVTDQATNEGTSATAAIVVDATSPGVTLSAPAFTNDTTPSVTVSVVDTDTPDGTPVRLDVDLNNDGDFADTGESAYVSSTLTGGAATFEVTPALAQGTFRLRARVTDQANNEGTSGISTLVVDTTAPAVTLAAPALTNDTTPSVTVTATDASSGVPNGTSVLLDVDKNNDGDFLDAGEQGYSAAALSNGSATFDISPALADGTVQLRARVADRAGNVGSSNVLQMLVDTTAPAVAVSAPASTTDDTPAVTVTASDADSGVPNGTQVRLDVDLNNNGSFNDAGEQGYTTSALSAGQALFDLTPALPPGTYRLRARVTDQAGNEGTSPQVQLIVENRSPANVQLSNNQIAENTSTASRVLIGLLSATDPNVNATLSFALTAGSGDADNGSFEISGNQLFVRQGVVLNHEVKASYSILVRASDNQGGATDKAFTIQVTNVDEAPSITSAPDASAPENQTGATTVAATDPDAGAVLAFSIIGGADAARFNITSGGVLTFKTSPNFEAPSDANTDNVYQVQVQVTDGTNAVAQNVQITVTDVNEAPTVALTNVTNSLPENTNTGSAIKLADIVVADDALGTEALSLSGADAAVFEIVGTELKLKSGIVLNFETKPAYSVTVNVDDATLGSGIDASVNYTLTITDVNEAPTVALANVTNSLPENTNTGSAIKLADIVVADDALGTEALSLSGADAAVFEIVGTELRLRSGTVLNFEAKPAYSVTVNVDDTALGSGIDHSVNYTLTITDVNEAPTVALAGVTTSLLENASTASAVKLADIVVTDDALGAETLTLSGTDAAAFEIVGTELRLKSGTVLDFEAKPSYAVTVNVNDESLGAGIDASVNYTLTITDVNEAPTVALANITTSLLETANTASPIKLADIVVTDDALGAETLSLSGTDAAAFEIVGTELRLKSGTLLNFEAKPSYAVTVNVDDETLGSGADHSVNYTLTITDVNEPPTVSLSNVVSALLENADTSSAIKLADIVVTDDALGAETLSLSGADAAVFEISGMALRLKAGTPLNFEAKSSYSVTVNVDDTALGSGIDHSVNYTLTITDVNEAITFTSSATASAAENQISVITVTASDPESDPLVFSIAGGADANKFNITAGGVLTFKTAPNFEAPGDTDGNNVYLVRVEVTDGTNIVPQDISVTVTDVNEAPTVALNPTAAALAENTSTASAIKLADIQVTDDALGNETLSLSGADAGVFEIVGTELRLKSGTVLNFEAKPSYSVTVNVDDPALGSGIEASASFTLTITDVNEAPTVALNPTAAALAENTSTGSATKLADIQVTDDALGNETLSLSGADAGVFEIVGTELRLKSGTVLNFEAKPSYSVTVNVNDTALGSGVDASASFTLTITDVNEAPTVALNVLVNSLSETANTSTAITLANIVVTDDALGAETLSLAGADAAAFEIVGGQLRLKAGTVLDFDSQSLYSVTVSVDDASLGAGVDDSANYTLTITPAGGDENDAPRLDTSGNPIIATVEEDDLDPPGTTIEELLGDSVTDPDAGAVEGIAVTGTIRHTWQYSLDGGDTWHDIGTRSNASALLLPANGQTLVRFKPNPNFNGTGKIYYRAWDQTSGSAGDIVDLSAPGSTGGSTAFSVHTEFALVTVSPVNDAPRLDAKKDPTLAAINEDNQDSVGTLVRTLLTSASKDADVGADRGIAVFRAESPGGKWQYSLTGGEDWTDFGAVDGRAARLLPSDLLTRIRFVPNPDFNGTAEISYRAWDGTEGTAGGTFNLVGHTGDETAFSSGADTATITVNAVNDAPVLDTALDVALSAINEGNQDSVGVTVGALIAGAVTDVDANAARGIAVTQVSAVGGTWQYSLNAGEDWIDFGTVSATSARLLASTLQTRIRFVPNESFHGTATIRYRAWDRTQGDAGGTFDLTGQIGGTKAFSVGLEEASITVNPVNDAPELANISGSVGYQRGASAPVLLAATATVADDSQNFPGGKLTVHLSKGATSATRLGSGLIRSNGSVVVGGVTIGTVASDGLGTNDLVIDLNADATLLRVQALLRSITFSMVGGTPGQRKVEFTLAEGEAGASNTLTKTVNVT